MVLARKNCKLTIAIFNSAHLQSHGKINRALVAVIGHELQETDEILSVSSLNLNIQLVGPAILVPKNYFAEVYSTSLCTLRY